MDNLCTLYFRRLVPIAALLLSLSAYADSRTWAFDLKTPGTYEIHVQHDYGTGGIPPGTQASYSFQTSEKTVKRDLPFYAQKDFEHPTVVLIAETTSPQKATVVVDGIPKPLLERTHVYVIEANSRYPYEWFDPQKSVDLKDARIVRDILRRPQEQIDLARAKLTIDKMIDPKIDIDANLKKIDEMVVQIKAMVGYAASSRDLLAALRRYVYEPGAWNNHKPFQYDLNDPLGTNLASKLLPAYMATKKGNCVSMPLLFVVLGQRLGLDITASTAPLHIFVKVKDEATGAWYNVETTSGANPARDVWYREQMPMTDQAVANGVYLQPLTRKETVALMTMNLVENYFDRNEFEKTITMADLVLEYYPKDVSAMIYKSNAYYELSRKYYAAKYRSPNDIPDRAKGHYQYLAQNNRLWGAKAIALGWRELRKEDDEKYLQSVKEAKAKQ